jgi:hypothetical protein
MSWHSKQGILRSCVLFMCTWEPCMSNWMNYKHLHGQLHTATRAYHEILRPCKCLQPELIKRLEWVKRFTEGYIWPTGHTLEIPRLVSLSVGTKLLERNWVVLLEQMSEQCEYTATGCARVPGHLETRMEWCAPMDTQNSEKFSLLLCISLTLIIIHR